MASRAKTPRLYEAEKHVLKAVLEYLQARRILAFRMQVGGAQMVNPSGDLRFVRFGAPGMADVLAFPSEDSFDVDGDGYVKDITPTWLECKSSTGKQSELQKSFQAQVEAECHRYVLVRSVEDVIEALK